MFYNDDDKYEGDWKKGSKDGKGIMFYNDGEKYEGDWKNDKVEGKGKKKEINMKEILKMD